MPDSVSRLSVVAIDEKYARGVRVIALALSVFALIFVSGAAARPAGLKLLVRDGNHLTLVGKSTINVTQPGQLAFSGDGKLYSIGGTIIGRATLPTKYLVWSPVGERAAWVTTSGSVMLWTPSGMRRIEPKGWGADWLFRANGLAWSADGLSLAIGRGARVWMWRNGAAHDVAGATSGRTLAGGPALAVPFAWSGDRVLWWSWPGSGSIAADGVSLYEGNTLLGVTLMYPDYTATCGAHVAFTEGVDRYSTDGKSMVFDSRVVAHDSARSYTEPACTAAGRLVAAVSKNNVPRLTNETHRSIWQLLPTRKQLTKPPWGWTDEDPRLYANGDLVFVRTRSTFKQQDVTQTGHVMLLSRGKLTQIATTSFTENELSNASPIEYYGHYDWTHNVAVWP